MGNLDTFDKIMMILIFSILLLFVFSSSLGFLFDVKYLLVSCGFAIALIIKKVTH